MVFDQRTIGCGGLDGGDHDLPIRAIQNPLPPGLLQVGASRSASHSEACVGEIEASTVVCLTPRRNTMNDVTTPAAKAVAKTPSVEVSPISWIRNEIDRLFDDFGRPARSMFFGQPTAPVAALELTEGKDEYQLSAELPGLGQDDVDIAVADGVLTISGEKKEEKEHKENGYLMSERRYGSFRREIALPADVDLNAIKARFKDGVLSLTMAKDKAAPARTRKIAIGK